MSPGSHREALAAVLGADAVEAHLPLRIEGCEAGLTLRPADGAGLAAGLRVLGERGLAALVRGGGSRLGLGNPPRRIDAVLDVRGLSGIETLDADEGVVRAGAGTPVAELADAVRKAGWELPLDPPGEGSTLGGALAAAAVGPRFGHPRDVVLGLDVALATGERTRCGGRVVKNVTGYDLMKLHLGALGTLGVIEAAWLRLRPAPEAVWSGAAALPPGEAAARPALAAARLVTVRVAAVLDAASAAQAGVAKGGAPVLVVELAGDAPAVEIDRRRLEDGLGAAPAEPSVVDAVRRLQGGRGGAEIRVRVATLPSRWHAAALALASAGARVLAYPGRGLVWGTLHGATQAASASLLDAAPWVAAAAGGHALVEEAPLAVRRARDVFGDVGDAVPLIAALRTRYDPKGVLAPGRMAGER